MDRREFESLVAEEFLKAVPEKFHARIRNVAWLIEREPPAAVRTREGLGEGETLLGYYHGVPATARGEDYGIGVAMPDTVTLYREPILAEARATDGDVRRVIRETIWHEVAHYLGMEEGEVNRRERERDERDAG